MSLKSLKAQFLSEELWRLRRDQDTAMISHLLRNHTGGQISIQVFKLWNPLWKKHFSQQAFCTARSLQTALEASHNPRVCRGRVNWAFQTPAECFDEKLFFWIKEETCHWNCDTEFLSFYPFLWEVVVLQCFLNVNVCKWNVKQQSRNWSLSEDHAHKLTKNVKYDGLFYELLK